ncbi:uncharacterized protein CLUP02_02023 [Colletotrichum lupini]|uniref:Uncharacterized protein n=1 Tax=Colletotrichum lupini TaxID=145971 RepID=A0A9Q8W9Q3_9PEZI|nr:uncharacterized protein CLUP02_02023 [Colletotrichum lupini]UQC75369.1 hypothetical protein CLUP02_02023 [Colletotrichum lupini]
MIESAGYSVKFKFNVELSQSEFSHIAASIDVRAQKQTRRGPTSWWRCRNLAVSSSQPLDLGRKGYLGELKNRSWLSCEEKPRTAACRTRCDSGSEKLSPTIVDTWFFCALVERLPTRLGQQAIWGRELVLHLEYLVFLRICRASLALDYYTFDRGDGAICLRHLAYAIDYLQETGGPLGGQGSVIFGAAIPRIWEDLLRPCYVLAVYLAFPCFVAAGDGERGGGDIIAFHPAWRGVMRSGDEGPGSEEWNLSCWIPEGDSTPALVSSVLRSRSEREQGTLRRGGWFHVLGTRL